MQLAQLDRTVTSSGIAKQQKMGMILDGTAFKILSDGLYSDKIGSLVRETYSNAVDSHIMAGEPNKPGWVQLPTQIDPTYVVRDEGIGLDEEGVMEVATTYFRSTKRSDNAAIGGFGLGFKSPFAYADAWTIVAIKDGFKRTFSAYMTETGEPNVALLTEERTNEPNGVEIRVPVKRQDISTFQHAVAKQLRFFDPRPVLSGITSDFSWPSQDFFIVDTTEGFRVRKGNGGYSRNNEPSWTAVSGPVGFPVDPNMFSGDTRLTPRARQMLSNLRGEIFFKVGEVMPAPSREALQYNPQTVTALINRFNRLPDVVSSHIKKTFEGAPNFWSASVAYEKFSEGLGYGFRNVLEGHVDFKGRKLRGTIFDDGTELPGVVSTQLGSYDLAKERIPLADTSAGISFPAKEGQYLLIDDLPSWHHRQSTRVGLWFREFEDNKRPLGAVVVRFKDYAPDNAAEKVIAFLDGIPKDRIVYLSNIALPEVPRAATTPGARSLPGLRRVIRGRVSSAMSTKDDADKCSVIVSGEVTPGYFVITEHNRLPHEHLASLINDHTFLPGEVYFVPKSLAGRVSPDDGWVDFHEAAKQWLKDNEQAVLDALKTTADKRWPNDIPYQFVKCFDAMARLGIPAPTRTRSDFMKLYREYLSRKQIVVTGEHERVARLAMTIDHKNWSDTTIKLQRSSDLEVMKIFEDFKNNNETFYEVLAANNYFRFSDKIVADLVRKLA